jgi:ABC-type antimicrobial peptide transport system permease subunit
LVIVIVITMLTVGLQSYRAANKKPVEALRYE